MPVPVRDTPLGRELYEEGRQEGQQEGRRQGRHEGEHEAILRMTALMLRRRFGDDPRIAEVAASLAALPDEVRLNHITDARSLDELVSP
jgi:predicted transposase YdaD